MAIQVHRNSTRTGGRWLPVGLLIAVAFGASFAYAQSRSGSTASASTAYAGAPAIAPSTGSPSTSGAGGACGCCGGGGAPAGSAKTAKAKLSGNLQTIKVDLSKGYYDPSTIELKAGVPAEITFGQSSGCTGQVQSADLGFSEDLSTGAKTVKLPALKAGTYAFACGMNMVTGSIVVK